MLEINKIYHGNALDLLKQLDNNSVDSIVTDPPYELGFMGKKWDKTGIAYNVELWKECLRVLKPGGHLLAFGGARTYHRMASAIEDAGFEIRDQIMWVYSQGFPKSTDISKAIDKKYGVERKVVGISNKQPAGYIRHGRTDEDVFLGTDKNRKPALITKPATPEAKQWAGWGTALKPAHEPIVVARKSLSEKTVVDNILKWGTGGINIDGCRIPTNWKEEYPESWFNSGKGKTITWNGEDYKTNMSVADRINDNGRFPANIILDEEAGKMLDEQSGITKSGKVKTEKQAYEGESVTVFLRGISNSRNQHGDSGGASRFFYCAKASKKERGEFNDHPTVKPIKLMEYLISLVTPPNGIVLDPFAGSGSTLIACKNKNYRYIGFEIESQYIKIANKRIESASNV